MAKKKQKSRQTSTNLSNPDARDSSAPGERSEKVVAVKKKLGLPLWKDLRDELEVLSERHGKSWAEELEAKVELHRKYVEYQTLLAQNFSALGLQHVNALYNVVDLQNKIFSLEEDLSKEGKNPLESPEWVKAREMLAKEMQFIHRHGLDEKKFQKNLEMRKQRNTDDMFTVEAE